jgi:hypothetical protein
MQARSGVKSEKPDPRQLRMFDPEAAANDRVETALPHEVAQAEQVVRTRPKASTRVRPPLAPPRVRVIAIDDMPSYPNELVDQVGRSIAGLPSEKLWFTYHDIRRSFGVSRATIARRMKEGLVPGLRFQDGRMLEDGAVRRLDREQLGWLLLAVQRGRDRGASNGASVEPR